MPCHFPLSISSIQVLSVLIFSEMYILSNYKYQLAISMNIQKDFTQRVSRKAVLVCKDPYLVLNNIYTE